MRHSALDRVHAEGIGGEYLPPIDLEDSTHEVWGLSWDRQVEAAEAWQDAGGNADGVSVDYAGGSGSDTGPPSMRTIMRMNTLTVSLRERLLQIQTEVANVAIAEMRQRQLPMSDAVAAAMPSLPQLQEDNGRRLEELTRDWFDVVGAALATMGVMTGRSVPFAAARPAGERRRRVMAIDFPDRRIAM